MRLMLRPRALRAYLEPLLLFGRASGEEEAVLDSSAAAASAFSSAGSKSSSVRRIASCTADTSCAPSVKSVHGTRQREADSTALEKGISHVRTSALSNDSTSARATSK